MRNLSFLKLTLFCLVFNCCSSKDVNNKQIVDNLRDIQPKCTFSLDTMILTPYEYLYIVKPYVHIDSMSMLNKSNIPVELKSVLENNQFQDSYCVLVFIKEGEIVLNARILRNIADFSLLEEDIYKHKQSFMLDSARVVHCISE